MTDKRKKKPGAVPGIYQWRGKEYIGVEAVAAAAGVKHNVVSYHLNRHGNLDRLGIGRTCNFPKSTGKKINVLGREWASRAEMGKYLGVHGSTVGRWLRDKKFDQILGAVMAAEARQQS